MPRNQGVFKGKNRIAFAVLFMVLAGVSFTVAYAYPNLGLPLFSGTGTLPRPLILAITTPQATIEVSITQGLGNLSVTRSSGTSGFIWQVSYQGNPYGLPTTIQVPVNAGDTIWFNAIPNNGYGFDHFGGPNGVSTTSNPWTLYVCETQMSDPNCPSQYYQGEFVHAYFNQAQVTTTQQSTNTGITTYVSNSQTFTSQFTTVTNTTGVQPILGSLYWPQVILISLGILLLFAAIGLML